MSRKVDLYKFADRLTQVGQELIELGEAMKMDGVSVEFTWSTYALELQAALYNLMEEDGE